MEHETEKCVSSKRKQKTDEDLQERISYFSEIYSIMHALGDVKQPENSSVKLMHNILESQMALLIENAENVMQLRKGIKITHEDVLFLMRKNKVLLKRLLKFLSVEDARGSFGLKKLDNMFSPEKGEKVSQCLKYLAFIEPFTGDLTSVLRNNTIIDYGYIKRMKRRNLMGLSMTKKEHKNFTQYTLSVALYQSHTKERFRKWLQQCSGTEFDITPLALSIIHFLARETIAVIVDKALEIKSRKIEKIDKNPYENFAHSVDLYHELPNSFDLTAQTMPHNVENIDESEEDLALKFSSNDFEDLSKQYLFNTPMKTNWKIHWFPNDAITPVEIQAAFIHYQQPVSKIRLKETDLLSLMPRKTNLICLINPDEQYM